MSVRGSKTRQRKSVNSRNSYGKTTNKSVSGRKRGRKAARKIAKAEYLASLPKNRWKRLAVRLKPSHLVKYWFSREGAIMALKVFGIGIVACFFLTIGIFAYFRKDLPRLTNISGQNLGGSVSYYDRTGKILLWQDYNAVQRVPVPSNQISPFVKNATVAIEDRYFYKEGAFSIRSIIRAGLHDLIGHGGLQGASTITEQVVKLNEGWQSPLTIGEKIKEVIIGTEVNDEFSKSQILTGYLNMAPYGGTEYGVQAAAEDYFHTSAANLTLAQAVMLAALPQAPSIYSPYASTQFNPEAGNSFNKGDLIGRMDYILKLMQQQGYISKAQEAQAKKVNILSEIHPLQGKFSNIQAPYFVMTAKQQLQKMFGATNVNIGGWKVITTLSVPQQNKAQQLVAADLPAVKVAGGNEEAMVVENAPTGQVTALVGGTNFFNANHGEVNYATAFINPGSTFKLYDYTTLINNHNNVGAGSVLYDVQEPLPGYPCTNKALPLAGGNCLYDYDYQYPGPLTIRYAFAGSRNVPAVKAWLINGGQNTIKMAEKMGLTSGYNCYANNAETIKTKCYASAAIGEGGFLRLNQSVNGFATDARLGNYVPQTTILKVVNSANKTIYQWKQPKPQQVVKPDAAYIVDNILSDPGASYLPGSCGATNCTPLSSFGFKFQHTNGWDVAIKTGTTHNDESGLMMGMTTQYVVGSWVANYTATKPLTPHYGGLEGLTEPLTRGMITYLTQNQKPINWQQPAGIKTLPSYVVNHPPAKVLGLYYGWQYPSPSMDIYPSWYVSKTGTSKTYTIDKVSGDLATSCTPADARETIYGSTASNGSIDPFWPLNQKKSSSLNVYDPIHKCSDQPPQLTITAPQQCNNTDNSGKGCAITLTATQGTHPLGGGSFGGTIALSINGKLVKTFPVSVSPATVTYYYSPTATGPIQISATVTDSVLYQTTQTTQMQGQYTPTTVPTTTNTNTNSTPTTSGSGSSN